MSRKWSNKCTKTADQQFKPHRTASSHWYLWCTSNSTSMVPLVAYSSSALFDAALLLVYKWWLCVKLVRVHKHRTIIMRLYGEATLESFETKVFASIACPKLKIFFVNILCCKCIQFCGLYKKTVLFWFCNAGAQPDEAMHSSCSVSWSSVVWFRCRLGTEMICTYGNLLFTLQAELATKPNFRVKEDWYAAGINTEVEISAVTWCLNLVPIKLINGEYQWWYRE